MKKKKDILMFFICILLGFTTTVTLSTSKEVEALTDDVKSLQNQLKEVEETTVDLEEFDIAVEMLNNRVTEIED